MFHWATHLAGVPGIGCHAAVVVEDEVYYFGGRSDNDESRLGVNVFNPVSLSWGATEGNAATARSRAGVDDNAPSFRQGHAAALVEGSTVYLWGGKPYCTALYAFDVDAHAWHKPEVSGTVPQGRHGHSACAFGKTVLICGGWKDPNAEADSATTDMADMYRLDTGTMVWEWIETDPEHTLATVAFGATVVDTRMFVFSGALGGSEVKVYDTEIDRWLPFARWEKGKCCHAFFSHNNFLYVFLGRSGILTFSELWRLDPETAAWTELPIRGVAAGLKRLSSNRLGMSCVAVGDRAVLRMPGMLFILELSPSLKTLCKLAALRYALDKSALPHNVKCELRTGQESYYREPLAPHTF